MSAEPTPDALSLAEREWGHLAGYRKLHRRVREQWPEFLVRRGHHLASHEPGGSPTERVAENIISELFTRVLDWELEDIGYQIQYADIVLSSMDIKRVVVEAKRPGWLSWETVQECPGVYQAWGYAEEQGVPLVVVCDGTVLYGAELRNGGLLPRLAVDLSAPVPSPSCGGSPSMGCTAPTPPPLPSPGGPPPTPPHPSRGSCSTRSTSCQLGVSRTSGRPRTPPPGSSPASTLPPGRRTCTSTTASVNWVASLGSAVASSY